MTTPFIRYHDLNSAWIERDLHLHTRYTDGTATVSELIRRAGEIGLKAIAITEHVRADSDWFPRFAEEVREAARHSPVRVLVGAEARISDFEGSLDISPAISRECDIVLGSVHRFPGRDGRPLNFSEVPREAFAEVEYRLALGFVLRGGADVLAHPGGMSLRHLGAFPDEFFRSLMESCRQTGVAIEINASYLNDMNRFLSLLTAANPLVSIGSDAHHLDEVGGCRNRLKEVLCLA